MALFWGSIFIMFYALLEKKFAMVSSSHSHLHHCFLSFFFLSEKGIVRMMKGIVNMMYMGLRFFDLWYCSVLTQLP